MRALYLTCGLSSLVLGFIGVFLPFLPTTPFVLLAGFCFARSSPKLHSWLLSSKLFGRTVADWEKHGVIRPRAKLLATVMITVMIGYPLCLTPLPLAFKIALALTGIAVVSFILSRPSQPTQPNN